MSKIISRHAPKYGLARVISKAGICSRSEAERRIRAGQVSVNGRIILNPEFAISDEQARIAMDGVLLSEVKRIYLMLNKPRGLTTTTMDERGRDTVYRCFDGAGLPWLAPVGRLDKASEGLLLFTNDTQWAAGITEPVHQLHKTYHVQVSGMVNADTLRRIQQGALIQNEIFNCVSANVIRSGEKNCWLEIVLDEGKNRHIRRLLQAFDLSVMRLIRISIGDVQLGNLAKSDWRYLNEEEVDLLRSITSR
jgi:23S rRNA pseudouridine2605 synthase